MHRTGNTGRSVRQEQEGVATIASIVSAIYLGLAKHPFLTFGAVWILVYLIRRNKRTATRSAMDLSFFVMIGSVSGLLKVLTGSDWGFWFIVFAVLTAAGFAGRELESSPGGLQLPLLLKWVCRPGFLVLSLLYILLWLLRLITDATV